LQHPCCITKPPPPPSPQVGDAEATVRRAFALARRSPPALLFFDEIDCLVTDRGLAGEGSGEGGTAGSVEARVLSTFLNEMDGIGGGGSSGGSGGGGRGGGSGSKGSDGIGDGLLVAAATNRPFALDGALLRPGRFDIAVHVSDMCRVHVCNLEHSLNLNHWNS